MSKGKVTVNNKKDSKEFEKKEVSRKPQKNLDPAIEVPAKSSEKTFLMKIKSEFINEGDKAKDIMVAIREYLKTNDLYHRRIKADQPLFGIAKQNPDDAAEEGKKIMINSIGRYIFGVPGFPSKVKFLWSKGEQGVCFLKIPENLPKECIQLLEFVAEATDETVE